MKALAIAVLFTVLLGPGAAYSQGYVFKGRPNCPDNNPQHNWSDYLQGKYGDATRAFSLKFDKLTAPLGSFMPNTCYTSAYESGKWYISLPTEKGRTPPFAGGDPAQLLINARGRMMKFNNFGQIIDTERGVVGTLKCGIGPRC